MIIVGAGGFAKEIFEVTNIIDPNSDLFFFDNVNKNSPSSLYNKKIITTFEEAKSYLSKSDNRYVLGVGNPRIRKILSERFDLIGGDLYSVISPRSNIGNFCVDIGKGATILAGATITSNVIIGKGLLMYPNSIITHDCKLGDFVELSPGATVLGNCSVGNYSHIGANATILPNVTIGNNVFVAAGSIVTKNTPDNCLILGAPARFKNKIEPIIT
jgi:sugar O-acyltransferase (sialic acid O-acetyltransferase NeuD family)